MSRPPSPPASVSHSSTPAGTRRGTRAVRAVPSNGVWWMGLGISLQAEKRNGEALDAFQRARASGGLSQELQGFVERRIQQLSH